MVSIITINLNNIEGLIKTEESIAGQTIDDFEWIIIDGGSMDGSVDFIKKSTLRPIWLSEIDNGIYDAMNKGILYSTKEKIIFLNSGDIFFSDSAIEKIRDEVKEPYDLYFFGFKYLGKERMPRGRFWYFWKMPTSHQAIVFNRDLFVGEKYNDKLRFAADYDFIYRMMCKNLKIKKVNYVIIENERYGSSTVETINEYRVVQKKYSGYMIATFFHLVRRLHAVLLAFEK